MTNAPAPTRNTKVFSISMDPALLARLDDHRGETGLTRSALVAEAVRQYLRGRRRRVQPAKAAARPDLIGTAD